MNIIFAHITGLPHHGEELGLLEALWLLMVTAAPMIYYTIKRWFKH